MKTNLMKKNMGSTDRFVRLGIAIALFSLYYANVIEGILAYILLSIAAVLVLTTFISFCPLYTLLGIKTCSINK